MEDSVGIGNGVLRRLLENNNIQGQRLDLPAGAAVYNAGDTPENFYLIETGQVRLLHINGGVRLLDILGPGDWIGSSALARLQKHRNRAVTASAAVVWAFPIGALTQVIRADGEIAMLVIQSMAKRLDQAWSHASLMASDDCRDRLIKTLLRFSESEAATPTADGVELRITHAQLAQAVGAARETISVCLTQLRQQNVVRTGRNRLFFDPKCLKGLKDGEVREASNC